MKKNTIIVLTKVSYLSYHPPPYIHSSLMCLLCVWLDINIIISYTTVSRRAYENRGLWKNILPQPPLITLWLLASYPHPCDDVAARKVSTMRAYCFPTQYNLQKIYHIFIPKSFLRPYRHSQQGNLTCLITISTQNSCLSYNIKSLSDLNFTKLQSRSSK